MCGRHYSNLELAEQDVRYFELTLNFYGTPEMDRINAELMKLNPNNITDYLNKECLKLVDSFLS